jgi:hypothetical protein
MSTLILQMLLLHYRLNSIFHFLMHLECGFDKNARGNIICKE